MADELPKAANVTAFAFSKRQNTIAPKGIENKYDEKDLEPFSNRTTKMLTGEVLRISFDNDEKTKFAEHIFANGTKEDFRYFDDLNAVVCGVLERLSTQQCQ